MKSTKWQKLLKWTAMSLFSCAVVLYFVGFAVSRASAGKSAEKKHPDVDFSVSCFECHQEVTPEVAETWSKSMHGQVNIKCFICHGDGQEEFYPKPSDTRCISCHSTKEVDFGKVEATSCFSCHDGHALKFHVN